MPNAILAYEQTDISEAIGAPPRWLAPASMVIGAIYLAVFLAWVVLATVLKPYSDQYSLIYDAWQCQAHRISLGGYLWMPHVGHHTIWVRLLTLLEISAVHSAWPTVVAATVTLLAAGATLAFNAWRDRRLTVLAIPLAILAAMPMLISVNALDADQPINALYCFSIVFALLALWLFAGSPDKPPSGLRRVIAFALAMCAAFGNGAALALWPAMLLLSLFERGRTRLIWAVAVIVVGGVFSGLYLAGPGEVTELGVSGGGADAGPLRRTLYFLVYLSLPVSQASRAIGIGGGLVTLAATAFALKTARDRPTTSPDRFAIGMIAFSLITAVLAAAGRGGLTAELIAPTRYAVFVAPLQAGVLMLLAPWLEQRLAARGQALAVGAVASLLVMLAAQVVTGVFVDHVAQKTRSTIAAYEQGQRTPFMTQLIYGDLIFADMVESQLRREGSFGKAPAELASPATTRLPSSGGRTP